MDTPDVDELLGGSRQPFEASIATRAALESLVDESRAKARRDGQRMQRRALWLIPGVAVAAGVLTAGAALFAPYFDPDVRIPIRYVTGTGVEVECTYALRVGSIIGGENPQLREWVTTQDWSGVGQRVYDDAMTHPFVPGPDDEGDWDAEAIDMVSFFDALGRQTAVPDGIGEWGDEMAGASDCTGRLR